jgi:hypothetical protein
MNEVGGTLRVACINGGWFEWRCAGIGSGVTCFGTVINGGASWADIKAILTILGLKLVRKAWGEALLLCLISLEGWWACVIAGITIRRGVEITITWWDALLLCFISLECWWTCVVANLVIWAEVIPGWTLSDTCFISEVQYLITTYTALVLIGNFGSTTGYTWGGFYVEIGIRSTQIADCVIYEEYSPLSRKRSLILTATNYETYLIIAKEIAKSRYILLSLNTI